MTTVKQLLDIKGRNILSISPNDSVYAAVERMSENNVGALLVLENGMLVGILSERDYARKVILKGKSSKNTLIREIMTPDVLCVSPETTVDECLALLTESRVRHLPVTDGGKLMGIVSIGDLVKQIISDKEFTIQQLEHYIHSA
ncbi:MAG TPA: CBS domain-containing protein [Sulfuricaulis sp.]|nr:CBS domain-containing protein [Sulfuricaulis sp.]